MAPPCFSDFGRQTRDVFTKNFYIGTVKLDCKTKTNSGVNFSLNGTSNNDTGHVNAHMETKYTIRDYGATLREKWSTDNVLTSEVSVEDQFAKGLKISAESNFSPQSGKKSGVLKTVYKNDHVHLNTDMNVEEGGATVLSSAVVTYQGWLSGVHMMFDAAKSKMSRASVGLGYSQNDFVVHSTISDGKDFAGYLYQKVNPNLESGMQLNWCSATNTTNFSLGCAYKIDDDTSVKAKVNNSSQIGLSFTHSLRQGIRLTLSTLIDSKNINQGGHKVGLGLELDG